MKHVMLVRLLAVLLCLIFALGNSGFAQSPIFVDVDAPGPTHDGASWLRAYTTLQPGLDDASQNGGHILVAEGVYRPTTEHFKTPDPNMPDARALSLVIPDGGSDVQVHGGFKGYDLAGTNSVDWDNPDGKFKDTVLDGLIGGGSVWHVVVIDGTGANPLPQRIVLDGFRVIRGVATTPGQFDPVHANFGAGIYINLSDDLLTNVWLENLIVEDCYAQGAGGGIYCASRKRAADPRLIRVRHCTIRENMAEFGAGINVARGALLICSTQIYDNGSLTLLGPANPPIKTERGGGIMLNEESEIRATNVLIYDNEAENGGASSWLVEPT